MTWKKILARESPSRVLDKSSWSKQNNQQQTIRRRRQGTTLAPLWVSWQDSNIQWRHSMENWVGVWGRGLQTLSVVKTRIRLLTTLKMFTLFKAQDPENQILFSGASLFWPNREVVACVQTPSPLGKNRRRGFSDFSGGQRGSVHRLGSGSKAKTLQPQSISLCLWELTGNKKNSKNLLH